MKVWSTALRAHCKLFARLGSLWRRRVMNQLLRISWWWDSPGFYCMTMQVGLSQSDIDIGYWSNISQKWINIRWYQTSFKIFDINTAIKSSSFCSSISSQYDCGSHSVWFMSLEAASTHIVLISDWYQYQLKYGHWIRSKKKIQYQCNPNRKHDAMTHIQGEHEKTQFVPHYYHCRHM